MSEQISIKGLDKGAVVAALYNRARAQRMGFLHYSPEPMTPEEGAEYAGRYIDYLSGRAMKVDVTGDNLDPTLYDRDNGQGAAARVIAELRGETLYDKQSA